MNDCAGPSRKNGMYRFSRIPEPHHQTQAGLLNETFGVTYKSGRYWTRTSDLIRVKDAL